MVELFPSAILLAFLTIVQWSFLAYLGASLSHVPPFLIVGIALTTSGLLGLVKVRDWHVPFKTFAVGVGGIFGYHFLYFSGLQLAPPVEVSLINYLWPLLIVILSPIFLTGYALRPHHILGAMLGLAGAGLIVIRGQLNLDLMNLKGYLFAAGAALTWASYSLLSKRLPLFPSGSVGGFCLASGLLSLMVYVVSNPTTLADIAVSYQDGFLLAMIGIGPMGLAFFTWDAALKRGDPRIIGSLAYVTPLTSTLVLTLLGGQGLTWTSTIAMVLIVLGAVIGSLDLFVKDRS